MDITINITEIIIALLTMICAILGWMVQRKTEKIKIIEQQLSEKKYKAYAELVSIFFGLLENIKKGTKFNSTEMMSQMLGSKKDIFIYGSDQVFLKLNTWLCSTNNEAENSKQMKYFLDLMLEIRKDMSGNRTKITRKDILINLIQNEQEVEKYPDWWRDQNHLFIRPQ